ncbi:MAG: hypothetical protein L3J63_10150 [Geopsychrobacter sp.]|nr:hypothetical protein [Geopsychrobacter sp.]
MWSHFRRNFVGEFKLSFIQIVGGLQIHPTLRIATKKTRKAHGGDGTVTGTNFVD